MKTSISQTISILRFPLCVVIVMIHSNIAIYNASANQFALVNIFSNYFIGDVCYYSLSLFFFISGFLLFREGKFNLEIFKKKINHRVYSLLIPYILWNLICFGMIFVLQQIKPNINLLLHKQIADFRIQDYIMIFGISERLQVVKQTQQALWLVNFGLSSVYLFTRCWHLLSGMLPKS